MELKRIPKFVTIFTNVYCLLWIPVAQSRPLIVRKMKNIISLILINQTYCLVPALISVLIEFCHSTILNSFLGLQCMKGGSKADISHCLDQPSLNSAAQVESCFVSCQSGCVEGPWSAWSSCSLRCPSVRTRRRIEHKKGEC